jgi:lipopolysaccharide/colanic/teichoic acid biosynthesis glycosyltransferase
MTDDKKPDGTMLGDSARLTPFGRMLRMTSLDELPELINVLKGEMSLVGPRPLLPRYTPYFSEIERVRFDVLPGITGLAQTSGRNDLSWDRRLELDVEYTRRMSLALDLRILAVTLISVLRRDGLQPDPGAVRLDLDQERKGGVARGSG